MFAHCSYVRSDNSLQACSLEEKSSVFPNFDMNGKKKMSPEVKMMQCLHCKGSGIFGVG